jgi:hypothetical protein
MKVMRTPILFIIAIFVLIGCSKEHEISLTNPSDLQRQDEPVVIARSLLDCLFNRDISEKFPLFIKKNGDTLVSQTDDLNGDGHWDEVFMLVNFMPQEKIKCHIILIDPEARPEFPKRTGLRFARVVEYQKSYEILKKAERLRSTATEASSAAFQIEGPGWENDRIAFRNYFDARNGIDIFGKVTPKMVIDSIGIVGDYHTLLWWGMDILKVGNSLGAGALAVLAKDSLYRLDLPESAGYEPVADGPLRSILRLTYKNWNVNSSMLDVVHEISTWGGFYGYQSRVTVTGNMEAKNLVTGIVNMQSDTLYTSTKDSQFTVMFTHDNQAYDGEKLGMGLILPSNRLEGFFEAPEEGPGVIQTYCAKLNLSENQQVTFRFYAGWEKSDPEFARIAYFQNFLESEALKWSDPVQVRTE